GATLEPMDISHVWMAGGSAFLPPVKMALRSIFNSIPRMVREPMFAVARGAAWKAGLDAGYAAGGLDVQERVFDGIVVKASSGEYRAIVPVRQRVPMPRAQYDDLISLSEPDNRLVLELYAAVHPVGESAATEGRAAKNGGGATASADLY